MRINAFVHILAALSKLFTYLLFYFFRVNCYILIPYISTLKSRGCLKYRCMNAVLNLHFEIAWRKLSVIFNLEQVYGSDTAI